MCLTPHRIANLVTCRAAALCLEWADTAYGGTHSASKPAATLLLTSFRTAFAPTKHQKATHVITSYKDPPTIMLSACRGGSEPRVAAGVQSVQQRYSKMLDTWQARLTAGWALSLFRCPWTPQQLLAHASSLNCMQWPTSQALLSHAPVADKCWGSSASLLRHPVQHASPVRIVCVSHLACVLQARAQLMG